MARKNKREEFYLSIKAILDKQDLLDDARELRDLMSNVEIDFNSKEFEAAVTKIVKKMSKETVSVITKSFNEVLNSFSKDKIELNFDLNNLTNEQMWTQMFTRFGKLGGEIIRNEIQAAIQSLDLSKMIKSSQAQGVGDDIEKQLKQLAIREKNILDIRRKIQKRRSNPEGYQDIVSLPGEVEDPDNIDIKAYTKKDIKSMGVDAVTAAKNILNTFLKSMDALAKTNEGTNAYYMQLMNAAEAARELYKMQGYIQRNSKAFTDEGLLAAYNGGNLSDITYDVFKELEKNRENIDKLSRADDKTLQHISKELNEIKAARANLGVISDSEHSQQDKTAQIERENEALRKRTEILKKMVQYNSIQEMNQESKSKISYDGKQRSFKKFTNDYIDSLGGGSKDRAKIIQQLFEESRALREQTEVRQQSTAAAQQETDTLQENTRVKTKAKYAPVLPNGEPNVVGEFENIKAARRYVRNQNAGFNHGTRLSVIGGDMVDQTKELDEITKQYIARREQTLSILSKEKLTIEEITYLIKEYGEMYWSKLSNPNLATDAVNIEAAIESRLGQGTSFEWDNYLNNVLFDTMNEKGYRPNEDAINRWAQIVKKQLDKITVEIPVVGEIPNNELQTSQIETEVAAHQQNAAAIQQEIDAQEQLSQAESVVGSENGVIDTSAELTNLEAIRAKVAEITAAVNEKTSAFAQEGDEVQRVVGEEITHLDKLEDKIQTIKKTLEWFVTNIKTGEADIDAGLSNIAGKAADSKTTANIAQAPWALEETLKGQTNAKLDAIKGVLDGIGTQEKTTLSTGSETGLATENTLGAIKTAVESINKKTVQGTKISKPSTVRQGADVAPYSTDLIFESDRHGVVLDNKLSEQVATALSSLSKYKVALQATGQSSAALDAELERLYLELKNVSSASELQIWNEHFKQFKNVSSILQTLTKDYAALGKVMAQADNEKSKAKKKKYKEVAEELRKSIAANMDGFDFDDGRFGDAYNKAYEATEREIKQQKELRKEIDKTKLAKKQAMVGKAGSAVNRAESTWLGATGIDGNATPEMDAWLDNYYNKIVALRNLQDKLSKQETVDPQSEEVKYLRQQIQLLNKDTAEMNELLAQYERYSGNNAMEIQGSVVNPSVNIAEYKKQLTDLVKAHYDGKVSIKGFNDQTNELIYTVQERGSRAITTYNATLTQLDGKVKTVAKSTKQAETFFEASMRKFQEISSYISAMSVFSWFGRQLRQGLQHIKEIDLALTELRKVTNETEETYDRFLQTAAKTGTKLGSTISAVTEATSTFAKLGYEMQQAAEMAEAAIVYKNVGDGIESTGDAADSIISTMKGFGLEASEAMRIVDRFNEVGKIIARR